MKTNAKPAGTEISIVSRQMSPNPDLLTGMPAAFQSVPDFVKAYETTDKKIADLAGNFVDAADLAKQKQDDILPDLAFMQSLLSKAGNNHHLVIEARKQGHKIPWWTDYYGKYKERLWESLRTMERRIAANRRDPSVGTTKRGKSTKPKQLTPLEHRALVVSTDIHEALPDLQAGHIDEGIKKLTRDLITRDRIDEYLARGVKPSHDNPDGDARVLGNNLEHRLAGKDSIESLHAHTAAAPMPQSATYQEWENHQIPVPEFKLKYFADASSSFIDRHSYAFRGSAFKKLLLMLHEKPEQVLANAQDFAQLAVVLRGAADNLSLLAAVIMTALNSTPAPLPPSPAPPSKPPKSTSSQASPLPRLDKTAEPDVTIKRPPQSEGKKEED